jgi:hypothetical protein
MIKMKKLIACAAAALAALLPAAASAQTCGVTGSAVAPQSINYDPFSASGLQQVDIPLTLTRRVSSGEGRTQQVNFVLTRPVGSPAYEITYAGTSILYTEGNLMGRPRLNSRDAGEINYNFGGGTQPDTVTLPTPIRVTVPANVDLSAGRPIEFDIVYVCDGVGGLANVTTPTVLRAAVRINVNVQSALQASYVGSILDFGQVGNVSTSEVQSASGRFTTSATMNNVRVASSGPYRVELTSQNNFRMTYAGGNLGSSSQTIQYALGFLGQRVTTGIQFSSTTCARAGVGGVNLPVQARLLEGGQRKAPSTGYSDIITITISPQLDSASGQVPCTGMPLPQL